MEFFEIVILGFFINYLASKMKKKKEKDTSTTSIKNKVIEGFDQVETVLKDEKDPSTSHLSKKDLAAEKVQAANTQVANIQTKNDQEEKDQAYKMIVDSTTIDRVRKQYGNELQALPKNLQNQINRLLKEGPQALKDRIIQLSAYHPNREKLLELANYYENLVIEAQEHPSKGDLIATSSTVTEDFNDFSDLEYEMEQFIIEGEELAEFSQPMQVEHLISREDVSIQSNQLKEAIIWSEILAPPKSSRK